GSRPLQRNCSEKALVSSGLAHGQTQNLAGQTLDVVDRQHHADGEWTERGHDVVSRDVQRFAVMLKRDAYLTLWVLQCQRTVQRDVQQGFQGLLPLNQGRHHPSLRKTRNTNCPSSL